MVAITLGVIDFPGAPDDHTDMSDIHYTDIGTGPTLVFTHSWGLNSGQWDHLVEQLVPTGFRCISYDRRGHGKSAAYDGDWTVDLLADDLAELIERLELDDVVLVGHSLGCGEIVRYLSRHGSARVSHAVFVAPQLPLMVKTPDNPEGVDAEILESVTAELERDVRQWCLDNAAPYLGSGNTVPQEIMDWTVDTIAATPVETLVATQRMGAHTDYRAELAELDIPVTLIHGDADVSTPIDLTGRRTAGLLPNVEFIVVAGAGHGVYLTHAEVICAHLPALGAGRCAQITREGRVPA